ncbi:portal protein [Mycobacterium phage Carthage]|nr:portal protein [Mycobacterium phage Carthage]
MAATSLRVVRRPKGSAPAARRRSLTAASQLITDPQKQMKTSLMGTARNEWQSEAWDFSESIGELSYYVSWRANSCSRTSLIPSAIDPDTGLPTGEVDIEEDPDAQIVADYVKGIADGPLGQAALIKRAVECLTVVGEVWIAVLIRQEKDPVTGLAAPRARWYAVTREEIKSKAGETAEISLPDGKTHEFNRDLDSLVRIWNPRPRKASQATSPVRACLETLREIERTTRKIKNAAKSRVMNNGVLFVPAEMSLPAAQAPIPAGQAQIPGAPVPEVSGVPASEQLATMIYQASVAAMEDENSQAAYIPLVASVAAEHLEKVQHIKFGNEVTEVEIKTRIDAITRLAMGLDVSPERLLGMSKGNHWSAWAIGDEDVQLHIKPVMDLICQAIYNDILTPLLAREGIDPTKYILWYDASGLTSDPDLSDEAVEAHDRGAITSAALRRLLNVGEDSGYDLTTLDGCREFAADVVTKNPELIAMYAPLLSSQLAGIEFPQPANAIESTREDEEDDEDSGARQQREPQTEDERSTEEAASLNDRAAYLVAERLLVNRALDLAGKRRFKVNDAALKTKLRDVPAHEYHRVLPPVRSSEIPRLIAGWDTALEDEVVASLGLDNEKLRNAVLATVRRQLTQPLIEGEVV